VSCLARKLRPAAGAVTPPRIFRFPGPTPQRPGCTEGPPSYHRAVQDDHTPSGWNLWPAMVFRSYGGVVECMDSPRRRPPSSRIWAQRRVWTMSTLFVSNCLVRSSDSFGFRVSSPVPSVFRARNVVRVPPRARVFPVEGLVGLCVCTNLLLRAPAGAHLCWWRLVWRLLLVTWTAVLLLTPSWPGALGTA
jgi:hypothetical protein